MGRRKSVFFLRDHKEEKMPVTKEWLDKTGRKLSVEDIRQMQLLYEQPEGALGPVVGIRSLYLSEEGFLYQCVEYYDEQKRQTRDIRLVSNRRSIWTKWSASDPGTGILRITGPAFPKNRRSPYGNTCGILKDSGPSIRKR